MSLPSIIGNIKWVIGNVEINNLSQMWVWGARTRICCLMAMTKRHDITLALGSIAYCNGIFEHNQLSSAGWSEANEEENKLNQCLVSVTVSSAWWILTNVWFYLHILNCWVSSHLNIQIKKCICFWVPRLLGWLSECLQYQGFWFLFMCSVPQQMNK